MSLDLHFLKTKRNVGQFLISFHPLVILTNLLFTTLTVIPLTRPHSPNLCSYQIKTNTALNFYDIDPYDERFDTVKLAYKEKTELSYETMNEHVKFNLKKLEGNTVVGF